MDPITSAIVAALGKLAEPAVKDAYEAFKKLLSGKFETVKEAVNALEKDPKSSGRQLVLAEEVEKSLAAKDHELLATVKVLAETVGGRGASGGTSVTQNVSGASHIFSGTGPVTVNEK